MRTPLRYPGGKTKFASKFLRLIEKKKMGEGNDPKAPLVVEIDNENIKKKLKSLILKFLFCHHGFIENIKTFCRMTPTLSDPSSAVVVLQRSSSKMGVY